jgi:hypothetical protein
MCKLSGSGYSCVACGLANAPCAKPADCCNRGCNLTTMTCSAAPG